WLRAEPKRSNPRLTEGLTPGGLKPTRDKTGRGCRFRDKHVRSVVIWAKASNRRNRRDSNPPSPASSFPPAALLSSSLERTPTKQRYNNPPIPLFKIPPAEWPSVQRRVAQGESLRQIAVSYQVSYEAVRRVLKAARQEFL